MTSAAIQHELDRLPDTSDDAGRATVYRRHLETLLCAARLQEAIDAAERWYARREHDLRSLDRRSAATVRRLVADARVRPSLAWTP